MLTEPGAVTRALRELTPSDFYRDAHRHIFEAISAVVARGEPAELVTVCDELRRRGQLDGVGSPTYLTSVISATPTAAHVLAYAQIVRKKARLREVIATCADISESAYGQPEDVAGLCVWARDALDNVLDGAEIANAGLALSYGDLLRRETEDIEWLVDALFPVESVSLLSGDAGVGKTWLALSLACAVATGEPWLNTFAVRQGPVLYYDLETAAQLFQQRLQLLARANPALRADVPVHFRIRPTLDLTRPETLRVLEADLEEWHPALVILDPLRAAHSGKEEDSGVVRAVYTNVGQCIHETGTAVILPHHVRKVQPGAPSSGINAASQRARGSTDHRAAADSHLTMSRNSHGRSKVEHEKSRYGEPVPYFIFALEPDDDGLRPTYIPMTPKAAGSIATAEAAILGALRDTDEPISRGDLMALCGASDVPERTMNEALKSLRDSGQIAHGPREGKRATYVLAVPEGGGEE